MNLGRGIKQLEHEARRLALMQCSSLLVPPAVSDGVHMNTAETGCQSISDVQETRYLQTQTATEHLVPVLHFPFLFLKGGGYGKRKLE